MGSQLVSWGVLKLCSGVLGTDDMRSASHFSDDPYTHGGVLWSWLLISCHGGQTVSAALLSPLVEHGTAENPCLFVTSLLRQPSHECCDSWSPPSSNIHTHSSFIYKHPFSYIDERLCDSQWTIWHSAKLIDNSHYWLSFLSKSPSVGLSGLLKVLRVEVKSERHLKGLACLAVQMVNNLTFNLFKCLGDCFHV